ncbi:Type I restriction modification DNA specificity domain [uncultured Bacteroides sp.]|nr:Type I restriction modification DNA specificity domain [uncultured Bacteroides sp.]
MITGQGLYPVYGGNGLRGFTESYNHDGDYILIGRQGALCGNIRKVTGKTYVTEHAIAVCASKENETTFLQYLFQKMKLGQYSDQSAQPGLAVNKLLRLNINVPSKIEQAKIAKILSLIDERIITQNKIIEKYESLIQAIIYQKKMDGIREGNWQKTELSKVLQERTEKNINGYTVCSVSVSQGVINQIEYLGRSFAAKETSHYNIVKYGDIVYTKSPTGDFPYGIVKRCYIKNAVAVSPLYGVYKPINDNIGVFLHFYFMQSNNAFNYLHPLIQKGAKNTINITNARFLENSIPLPKTEDEVVYIANALTSIQTKIDVEKSLLCSYEKEKQYLLRQMFI